MGRRYDEKAIRKAEALFIRYNGQNFDAIEAEMRKEYPHWSRQNLFTRQEGGKEKVGWIDKYGWRYALELKARVNAKEHLTGAERLYDSIRKHRERVEAIIDSGAFEKEDTWAHQKYIALEIDALAKLRDARNRLEDFSEFWETLLVWLAEISRHAHRELLIVAEQVTEKATKEYGTESRKN
jgi:hypothetical protein